MHHGGTMTSPRPCAPETKEILLTQGMVTIVDSEDFERLSKYKWQAAKNRNTFYAKRGCNYTTIMMHRIITDAPKGMEVDHINGNGLDNRKCNLRIVSTRENQINQHVKSFSKYPGVEKWKFRRPFRAYIEVRGKRRFLGSFTEEIDAAKYYAAFAAAAGLSRYTIVGGCCND